MNFTNVNIEVGLRFERLKNQYYLNEESTINKNYNNIFPSLSISFPVKKTQMSISFAEKTQRPTFYQLRNSTEYVSQYLYESGNPFLLPMNIYDFTYNLDYKFIQLSFNYQYIKNYISNRFLQMDNYPNIILGGEDNYPRYQEGNIILSINKSFGFWSPAWNFIVCKTFFENNFLNVKTKYNQPFVDLSANNTFKLPQEYLLNLDIRFSSSGNRGELYIKSQTCLNMGIRKSFFNQKLDLNLQLTDIFASQRQWTEITNRFIRLNLDGYMDTRSVKLTLIYKFNHYKKEYSRKNASEEYLNRL
jgi:hypothetical protein